MTCRFHHDDGAYVLGALPATDRVSFERHLATCADCSRSVRELAGLPGLLSRVPAEVLELPPVPEPVPATLLPNLVGAVRQERRRRSWLTSAVAAAVLAAVTGGALGVSHLLDEGEQSTVTSPVLSPADQGPALRPVGDVGMSARVAMTTVPWGTRLDLTCSYDAAGRWGESHEGRYALVVRSSSGLVDQVATWHGLPGKTMHLEGATAIDKRRIRSVEIRAGGKVVLWLTT